MMRDSYGDIFSKTIGIIGGSTSGTTKSILRFVDYSKIQVISGAASAVSLNNKTNFCRAVPDDSQQATVMIAILKKMNFTCAVGLYANTEYGINGDAILRELTSQNDINYLSITIDVDLNATKTFVETSKTDIVLVFADLFAIEAYFDYLRKHNSKAKKMYIFSDSWVNSVLTNIVLNFLLLLFFFRILIYFRIM